MKRPSLLFDLDGTLTDSREAITHSIQYALEQVGVTGVAAEVLSWCVGPPLVDSLDKLLGPELRHLARQALEHYQQRYQEVGIFENRPYDGIQECLLELEKSANLYVATSNLTRFSKQILVHFSLAGHFQRIHGCEDWSGAEKSLIIADLMMEEIDSGTGMVKELKLAGNRAPVLLLSSLGDSLTISASTREMGLDAVFQKPVNFDAMLKTIKAKLGQ